MTNMKKIICFDRIKQLRLENGLTQTQLAKETGFSQSAIAAWEAGERMPSADAIIKLANYFEVTTDYLLGLSDDDNKN